MPEYQVLFNLAATAVGFLFGWVLNNLWTAVKELQEDDKELAEKVGNIEVLVAGRYMTRDEFNTTMNAIFTKLDRIQDILSNKADR
jgi:hypothetical protein